MANPLAVGQILRASTWSFDSEQASVQVMHYKVTAVGGSPCTDADFAVALDNAVFTPIKVILNNNATYRGIEAQILWPLPFQLAVSSVANAGVGSGGAISAPRQVAALTTWKTAIAGKHGRGRTYWPFPPANAVTADGVILAAYLTAIQTLYNAYLNFGAFATGGRTATVAQVVYDRVAHVGTPTTGAVTTNKWATQKRRGSFGRANTVPI